MNLDRLVRPNILNLKPYSSARSEFKGKASVYLDANESPYNTSVNRYPDPLQLKLKEKIAKIKGVRQEQIFLGVGSDEPIDGVYRIFCNPGTDNAAGIAPTYDMYRVAANINDVAYRSVLLDDRFDFSADRLLEATDERTKLIFLCSPNNPTGNSLNRDEIVKTIRNFPGIVILDEAYIDFSSRPSMLSVLDEYPNLVVLQTFSKAWGSAAVRLGMAFAAPEIIGLMNKVKYPYNINGLTQDYALRMLEDENVVKERVKTLLKERDILLKKLSEIGCVKEIYPTDANFILAKVSDADAIYRDLVQEGIIVRNRNTVSLCGDCIRITVGTSDENKVLMEALKSRQG